MADGNAAAEVWRAKFNLPARMDPLDAKLAVTEEKPFPMMLQPMLEHSHSFPVRLPGKDRVHVAAHRDTNLHEVASVVGGPGRGAWMGMAHIQPSGSVFV